MAGQLGNETVTTQNLSIVRVDVERGLIMVRGAVPGSEGSYVRIRDAIKKALPAEAPKPGAFRTKGGPAKASTPAPAETPAEEVTESEVSAVETTNEGGEA
jgi:large subunit ribosomal protein L3